MSAFKGSDFNSASTLFLYRKRHLVPKWEHRADTARHLDRSRSEAEMQRRRSGEICCCAAPEITFFHLHFAAVGSKGTPSLKISSIDQSMLCSFVLGTTRPRRLSPTSATFHHKIYAKCMPFPGPQNVSERKTMRLRKLSPMWRWFRERASRVSSLLNRRRSSFSCGFPCAYTSILNPFLGNRGT